MKYILLLYKNITHSSFLLVMLFFSASLHLQAQDKQYATKIYDNNRNVDNINNAVDGDETTFATLKANPGLLGLTRKSSTLGLEFTDPVPAQTSVYVKVDANDRQLLEGLLGGSLAEWLDGLIGGLLTGGHDIKISLYDGNDVIIEQDFNDDFQDSPIKLIKNKEGDFLFVMNVDVPFNRILFETSSRSVVGLSGDKKLDIYAAFYHTESFANCGRPIGTSFDGSGGLDLDLLNFGDQHLERAIDEDEDSYATLENGSLLSLSVANTLSQYFYFPTESSETASVNMKLGMSSSGLLDLDLLGATEVVFYNKDEEVYKRSLKSSLLHNTNALNLLDAGDPVLLTFAPSVAFDKVELRLNSPVDLSLLSAGFRIYDIQRYDDDAGCTNSEIAAVPNATDDPFDESSCASDLIDFENVDFAQRAVDGNNESFATIYADAGSLLVSGPTAGFIEMDLGETLPANKTTYVRIGYEEDVLDALLGGSLGKLVGDLANDLLLGNQYIQVQAKNGNNVVLDEDSSNAFEGTADGVVTLVEDNIGRYYLAITPDSDYNRIRITNHVKALLPTGKQASLDVYNACFEIGEDHCFPANFTSYKGGGLNLSLGDLSDVGVKDPYKAISENSSEYSEINLGVAGIAANVYQTIYFNKPSQENDKVKIRMQIEPSSALSLDLLGAYKIKFYNGKEQVGPDYDLQSGLLNNIDLLALFNSGGMVELEFEPEATFDRVDIGAESIVSLNVAVEPLRVYSVKRYGDTCPLIITESPFEEPSCSTELVDSKNADNVQNLFDEDFDSFATLNSGAGTLLGLGNKFEGFVEMKYPDEIAAETTTYIRFDFDEGILDALLSGSLGDFAGDLLDNIILGNHYFEVEVKDANGNEVISGSSKEANAGGNQRIRVVQDAAGRYYIAITPDQDYQSIKITDHTNSALGLLAQPNSMNVYGMCYETSPDMCLDAFATSYEYSGLNLGVDPLGAAGVTNAEYALDGNSQHYSEISNGTLGVGASTKQWIFFNTVSEEDDVVMLDFSTEGGVADVDVLGGLEIKAYLGETEVANVDWGTNGIVNGVNVLDLLSNNEKVELPFAPGVKYDRISVGIKTLLNVSVFPPVHLYSVERCFDLSSIAEANNDTAETNQNTPVSIDVVANDIGMDATTVSITTQPEHGTVEVHPTTGIVTYWPTTDYSGTDSFEYEICTDDTRATCGTATVSIEVVSVPCSVAIDGQAFDWIYKDKEVPNGTILNHDILQPAANAGFVFDIFRLDNSFNMFINEDVISSREIQFQSRNTAGINIRFQDGDQYELDTEEFYKFRGDQDNPILRVIISPSGEVSIYGSKESYGKLYPLELFNGAEFQTITWNPTDENQVMITQIVAGPTVMDGVGYGLIEMGTPEINIANNSPMEVCFGQLAEVTFAITDLADGTYTLNYDGGSIENVELVNGEALVMLAPGNYENITIGEGVCASANGVSIEILEGSELEKPSIVPDGSIAICSGEFITLTASEADAYRWYKDGVEISEDILQDPKDPNSPVIDTIFADQQFIEVTEAGDYTVVVYNAEGCASEASDATTITVNPVPKITVDGSQVIYVATGATVNWPTVTAVDENDDSVAVAWYDSNLNGIGSLPTSFAAVGNHIYYAVADSGGCTSFETILVNVYDADACPPTMQRVYATEDGGWGSIITGGVSSTGNAVDGNPKTHSTITTGLGLLGIGTTWQNLEFDHLVPAGTPVTIKLGKEYSGLALAGGLSVVGIGENGADIGVIKPVAGGLLDLLVADNVVEFTFVPSSVSGPKAYKGVRISQGSLVGVAQNAKVYGAYYTKEGAPNCDSIDATTNPDVLDVLHGVKDLGLGLASSTASVVDPWNAVDGDLNTSAKLVRGVSVANAATLTVIFKQPVQPTDEIGILMKDITNNGLNLNLLTGYQFQRYMGDTPVGDPIQGGDVLNLKLLFFSQDKRILMVDSYEEPYDRIMIAVGSIVEVALSDQMEVFDVSVRPSVVNEEGNQEFEICQGSDLFIEAQDECTVYEVYDAQDVLLDTSDGLSFELPAGIAAGEHTFYVQAIRSGCTIGPKQEIKVKVLPSPILNGFEVTKNDNPSNTLNPNGAEIDASPSDVVIILPNVAWGDDAAMDTITWEMQNPEDSDNWMAIAFGVTDTDGSLHLTIPNYGEMALPDGTLIDIRNTDLKLRAVLESDNGCVLITEDVLLKIDGKSALLVNPHITNKLKN